MQLQSISKPVSLDQEVAEASVRTTGNRGNWPDEASRSVQYLVGKGKSSEPVAELQTIGPYEAVIGVDTRHRILDTDLTPWRRICSLQMRGVSGSGAIGTGWLVGPRTVITAGHCVFSQQYFAGWAQEITVIAGRNGPDEPFARTTSQDFSSTDRWIQNTDPDYDIGCIHLDDDIGNTVGWFSVATLPADDLQNHLINVSGYPLDRGNGTQLWTDLNRILRVTERRIFYDVDTYGGESGGPAWILEEDDAPPTVVGIHAYGLSATPANLGITANSAPRITPEVLDVIEEWVNEDGGWPEDSGSPTTGGEYALTYADKRMISNLIRSELQRLRRAQQPQQGRDQGSGRPSA